MLDTDEGMFKTTSDFGMSYLETPLETIPSFGERFDPPQMIMKRYGEHWSHTLATDAGRAELYCSAVTHPFLSEDHLLLHKGA